jgi:hypothetical protein
MVCLNNIKKIIIEKQAESAPLTQRVLDALPGLPVTWVDQGSVLPSQVETLSNLL